MSDEKFLTWVLKKLTEEGMTYQEFGKKAGFSKSHVSLVLSGKRSLTRNFCAGIAKAFELKEGEVFYLAGFSGVKEGSTDYQTQDYITLFRQLKLIDREKVISYIRFLIGESK
jgi:transcriptional regulator with XRE-family HTH domain